uniref:Uncharacterized protein n=1 Tax=Ophiocordyceps sinensis TaxID=72228 RepID=A0A513WZW9_9HYPO|nr:hypothetical protein [Ophiocordyceps sinensis]
MGAVKQPSKLFNKIILVWNQVWYQYMSPQIKSLHHNLHHNMFSNYHHYKLFYHIYYCYLLFSDVYCHNHQNLNHFFLFLLLYTRHDYQIVEWASPIFSC